MVPTTRPLFVRLVGAAPVRPGGGSLDLPGMRDHAVIRVSWYIVCDVTGCPSYMNLIDRPGQESSEGVGRYLVDRAMQAGWLISSAAHLCPAHNAAFMATAVEC